jgi:hypothetical protein
LAETEARNGGNLIDFPNDPDTLARIRQAAICRGLRAALYLAASGRDINLEFVIAALTVSHFVAISQSPAVGEWSIRLWRSG